MRALSSGCRRVWSLLVPYDDSDDASVLAAYGGQSAGADEWSGRGGQAVRTEEEPKEA
jgi:hypothetical protein